MIGTTQVAKRTVLKTVAQLQQGSCTTECHRVCASGPLPARQHRKQNRIAPPEVMIERGGGVEASEPDQHIAKPAVEIGQHKAQLP